MQSPIPRCDVHGTYVISTEFEDHLGRISYVDDTSGLVWVYWQPWRSRRDYGASGVKPETLKVIPAPPKPWFKEKHYLLIAGYRTVVGTIGIDYWTFKTNDLREAMRSVKQWLGHQPQSLEAVYELAKEEPVWSK
jgi:hypothetical protein